MYDEKILIANNKKMFRNGQCIQCGDCIDVCPVKAASLNGATIINTEECIGGGLCAKHYPSDAMSLKEVRPAEFVPE